MNTSPGMKVILRYVLLFAICATALTGIFVVRNWHDTSLNTEKTAEQWSPFGNSETCFPGLIYTSLPPKCKNSDGSFNFLNKDGVLITVIPTPK